ncbi:Hpt domain-containing protein [Chlorobium sp.]|uniref:Hpt domain-containing protein n=1 Tax=Chlorobium sp. TaxID=1095 RepID=UPI002F42AF5C
MENQNQSKTGSSGGGGSVYDGPVFQIDELLLRLQNDEEIIRIIIAQFMLDTPVQIRELQEAVTSGQTDRIRHISHTIKGSAATVAAEELRALSSTIEQSAKNGNVEEARSELRELPAAFIRYADEVSTSGWYRESPE